MLELLQVWVENVNLKLDFSNEVGNFTVIAKSLFSEPSMYLIESSSQICNIVI